MRKKKTKELNENDTKKMIQDYWDGLRGGVANFTSNRNSQVSTDDQKDRESNES